MQKKSLDCSVLIATSNRPKLLLRCVTSILKQDIVPREILIAYSSESDIQDVKKYRFLTFVFSKNLIPIKRNLLINKARHNVCVFIDDDVELLPGSLHQMIFAHTLFQNVPVIGGVCYPKKYNAISHFIFNIFYKRYLVDKSVFVKTDFCPTMLFSFKKNTLLKNNVTFDENFLALEDIDFCYQLGRLGFSIIMYKKFIALHSYRSNIRSFISSFDTYFRYVPLFLTKYKHDVFQIDAYHTNNLMTFLFHFYYKISLTKNFTQPKIYNFCLSVMYELMLLFRTSVLRSNLHKSQT